MLRLCAGCRAALGRACTTQDGHLALCIFVDMRGQFVSKGSVCVLVYEAWALHHTMSLYCCAVMQPGRLYVVARCGPAAQQCHLCPRD
jgi:hypothetical protein